MGTKFNFLKFDEEKGYETTETPPDGYGQATIMLRPNFIEDNDKLFVSEVDYNLMQGNKVTHLDKKYVVMDKEFVITENDETVIYTVGPVRGEYREPNENEKGEYTNYCRRRQMESQARQQIAVPGASFNPQMQQGKGGKVINLR
jgi:hypothetical protein